MDGDHRSQYFQNGLSFDRAYDINMQVHRQQANRLDGN